MCPGEHRTMNDFYPPLVTKPLPKAIPKRKAFGVGVIALGLAIGSGPLILWPHLVATFGLGILWGGFLGIILQYFINQEVARNSLATGESFFMSVTRVFPRLIFVWLVSALLLYMWPGWAGAMGTILTILFGFGNATIWSWVSLSLVLGFMFSGKSAYSVMEKGIKFIMFFFFVLLIVASVMHLDVLIVKDALRGMVRFGWFPNGIDTSVFMAAMIFAGAGGLLNVCISFWYRDKGFGMGAYSGRIENPITGTVSAVSESGFRFDTTPENLKNWRNWMNLVRIDQLVFFGFFGLLGLLLLSMNAFAILSPGNIVPSGVEIIEAQAHVFGNIWGALGYKGFLVMAYLALFSSLWIILDVFTRIVSDIVYTNAHNGPFKKYFSWAHDVTVHHIYYAFFVFLVIVNAVLIPFGQPFFFLVTSAVLGGVVMTIYTPLLLYINNTRLPKEIRPSWFTNIMLCIATIVFAYFSIQILLGFI
jgi:hypothetical protein